MWIKAEVDCPICQDPKDVDYEGPSLKVSLDIVEETEGDTSIPYGTHTYLTYQDYRFPAIQSDHFYCTRVLLKPDHEKQLETVLEAAWKIALPLYEEGTQNDNLP